MAEVKIFSGTKSRYLASKVADSYGKELGKISIQKFADSEISVAYEESVRGCDVFLVQGTFPNADNLMELLLMIDAARRASAHYVVAVIPYYGYARQDRKDRPRVAVGAKLVANMLVAAGADRIMTLDLHAGQIQGFFDIPVDHLEGTSVFVPYLKTLNIENLIFASPDVGGVSRVRKFASHFEADIVICDKYRKKANEIAGMQLIGDVEGANVVLVDDLIDTGGTICKAAQLIMDKGAKSVRAICTHPVLSHNAHDNILNSVFTELIVTDSIPLKQDNPKIKVLSVAELFGKAIGRIRDNGSISTLFINYQHQIAF
ncbi:ribose-phosphate diphosphokinase [Emticicia sp. CRIBPO]|uniref:ribose-phosphate pyrophosphokinase n=1 Tax=Emticicia sp. CRIBPO TaxID=2683258 RepID=UPI0014129C89|nr:ribose-phosphate pyrophosphokinase [Emticicia sp. CRIBPO]NBA84468.1 ribose-phosphate diphosphokinase [Emticicia sp. CRIBPO]